MSFYFLNESIRGSVQDSIDAPDLPVKIEKSEWAHLQNPRRLSKAYRFNDPGQQRYFVSEVLKSVDTRNHAVKISIESSTVIIETRTSFLEDITQIDLDIAKICDGVFEDALFVVMTQ